MLAAPLVPFQNNETPPEAPLKPPKITGVTTTQLYAGFIHSRDDYDPTSWINFDFGSETGPVFSTFWEFGGGATPNTSSEGSPSNIAFTAPGVFQSRLTVGNTAGSDSLDFTLTVLELPPPTVSAVRILTKLPDGGLGAPTTQLKAGMEYWFIAAVSPLTSDNVLFVRALPGAILGPPQLINWVTGTSGDSIGFEPYFTEMGSLQSPNMWLRPETPGSYEGYITVTNPTGSTRRDFTFTVIP
jgi:hypothetical protein